MKRILVPCNFSVHSERALRFSIEIAKGSEGIVFLYTVLNNDQARTDPSVADATTEKFVEFIKGFDTGKVRVSHHIKTGKITPAILEFIEKEKMDLVIMGTAGSRGWDETFMGSNIGKIVRTSPIPVLAIKNEVSIKHIRNIVFPFSMIPEEKHLIPEIMKLQAYFDARLHLLFVNTNPRQSGQSTLQNMKEYAALTGFAKYSVNVVDNEIEKDGILQFAKEINADMIAMGTHGNRSPDNMYVHSIAADVVNHAGIITWTCATQNPK